MRRLHLFLDLLAHWWHRATSSRYLLMLEARVRQLEADNAAMRDTIFGLRGLPPLPKGVPAQYSAPSAQPAAAFEPPAVRPKVEAVGRRTAMDIVREKRARITRDNQTAQAAQVKAVREQYQKAVADERARLAGKGYAVPAGASEPVAVEDPVIETEPAVAPVEEE